MEKYINNGTNAFLDLLCTLYRPYVILLGVNTKIIFYLGSRLTILGYLFNNFWSFLLDKFGFLPIMKKVGFICCAMTLYFYLFMNDKILYPIGLIFTCSTLVGILSSFTPHLM